MATNLPPNVAFDKMPHFDNVAAEIRQTFDPLIDHLIARRNALLQRVQELREDHRNKEANRIAAIEELERIQQQMQEMSIKINPNIEFHRQASEVYQQGLRKQEPSATFLCPIFRCQRTDTIRELIAELGEIVPCEITNYSLKTDPILTAGEFGKGFNELKAKGIAFDDTTELIYLADYGNSCVRVVSLKGETVKQFGNDKLRTPCGIAVTNECIYVTNECILDLTDIEQYMLFQYALFQFRKKDFKFLNKTGTLGTQEGQLLYPRGLCIDTNGDVMVADNKNNRISVFSKQLKFKSCLGIGHLQYPQDVKLSDDRIVVLDHGTKCLHFFSRDGHLLSSCVPQGRTQDSSVNSPHFFCLDAANNIIISDHRNHAIRIFTELGQHIHTIGREGYGKGEFICPMGVCISKLGNIFVVSYNRNYRLQCF